MLLPKEIIDILSGTCRDMAKWNRLIQLFKEHQDNLNKNQKLSMYIKSEECRAYWNSERVDEEDVQTNMGEWIVTKKVRNSLNIKPEDIHPNNMYIDKDVLHYIEHKDDPIEPNLPPKKNQTKQTILDSILTYLHRFLPVN